MVFFEKNLNTAKRSVAVRLFPDGEGLSEGQAFPLPGSAKKMRWCRVRACPCEVFPDGAGASLQGHCNGASLQWSRVPGFAPRSTPSQLSPLGGACVEFPLLAPSVTLEPAGRVRCGVFCPAAWPDVQIQCAFPAGFGYNPAQGLERRFTCGYSVCSSKNGSRDSSLGAVLPFMARPLQNAGSSVAVPVSAHIPIARMCVCSGQCAYPNRQAGQ